MDTPDATAELAVYASEHDIDLAGYLAVVESIREDEHFGPLKDAFAARVLSELQDGSGIDEAVQSARSVLPT